MRQGSISSGVDDATQTAGFANAAASNVALVSAAIGEEQHGVDITAVPKTREWLRDAPSPNDLDDAWRTQRAPRGINYRPAPAFLRVPDRNSAGRRHAHRTERLAETSLVTDGAFDIVMSEQNDIRRLSDTCRHAPHSLFDLPMINDTTRALLRLRTIPSTQIEADRLAPAERISPRM